MERIISVDIVQKGNKPFLGHIEDKNDLVMLGTRNFLLRTDVTQQVLNIERFGEISLYVNGNNVHVCIPEHATYYAVRWERDKKGMPVKRKVTGPNQLILTTGDDLWKFVSSEGKSVVTLTINAVNLAHITSLRLPRTHQDKK